MKKNLAVIGLIICSLFAAGFAQDDAAPATKRADRPPTRMLVYDIRGLLQGVKAPRGEMLGGADKLPEMINAYIKLIEDAVNSDTWRDNGGDLGMIRELNGLLVVTQTDDAHRQIDELLNQLTDKQARLVRVRAHWIMGTPDQLQFGDKGDAATRQIDPNVLNKLPKDVVHHRAETVCFSGQTVSLQSGGLHGYVSKLSPVVGTQSVGYDATMEMGEDGAELEVTPAMQTDGKSAWLDLESRVTHWIKPQAIDMKLVSASTTRPVQLGGETVMERPNISAQTLRTSLRVPVGKAVVVGGMTVDPGLQSPNGPQMMLIIEVFVD
ncbi:MAG: hypothetical protein H7Z14_01065 [Anaerolineae bacterium]|nr:hypothetical protein [Phycisphaerae bacterium]